MRSILYVVLYLLCIHHEYQYMHTPVRFPLLDHLYPATLQQEWFYHTDYHLEIININREQKNVRCLLVYLL